MVQKLVVLILVGMRPWGKGSFPAAKERLNRIQSYFHELSIIYER